MKERNYKREKKIDKIILYIILSIIGLAMVMPFIWMIVTSISTQEDITKFRIIPREIKLSNYIEVFRQVPFHLFYLNSLWSTIVITIGKLITASLAGYAFARIKFRFRDAIFLTYLATLMIPQQVTMIPIFIVFKKIGWVDTYAGLIFPQIFTAYGTFMMRQFFLTIPKEIEESAKIDGANNFIIYFKIFLPLSKPALASLGTFAFIWSWNNFMWPLIILNSLKKMTLPVGISMFQSMYSTQYNLLMAAAVLAIVPVIVVYLFVQRFFKKGIATSGLKG